MDRYSQWTYDAAHRCYVRRGVSYCQRPAQPQLQVLNLYAPEQYIGGGTLAGYRSETAPVILLNGIGGYAECSPVDFDSREGTGQLEAYLRRGFVVACPGSRGNYRRPFGAAADGMAEQQADSGKSPDTIVDLKAAVRFLKAYAAQLPGDMGKIVSVGTSAGGAMSALLAVSADRPEYDPYLERIGACMEQSDRIFAAQCYCPIISLTNADAAYEWMFGAETAYRQPREQTDIGMTEFEKRVSAELKAAYPAYVNGLELGLTLGPDGRSGSFYDAILHNIDEALEDYLKARFDNAEQRRDFVRELNVGGEFLCWDPETGTVHVRDLDSFVLRYNGRIKPCPSFDRMSCDSPENTILGTAEKRNTHFSPTVADAILLASGGCEAEAADYSQLAEDAELARRARLLDPMSFAEDGPCARHIRIRLGTRDPHTSFSISYTLASVLGKRKDVQTDYRMIWDLGHCAADVPNGFEDWVDDVCGQSGEKQL